MGEKKEIAGERSFPPATTAILYYTIFLGKRQFMLRGYKLKSIKVSEAVYQKLKKISSDDKLTISEAVEKLLSTFPLQGCGGSGGNQHQEGDFTFYRRTVENHGGTVESREVESASGEVEYVTRREFYEVIEKICNWSSELLESLKKAGIDLTEAEEDQEEDKGSEYASEDQEEGEGLECSQEAQEED